MDKAFTLIALLCVAVLFVVSRRKDIAIKVYGEEPETEAQAASWRPAFPGPLEEIITPPQPPVGFAGIGHGPSPSKLGNPSEADLKKAASSRTFQCMDLRLTDQLRSVLLQSQRLEWFRPGPRATADDLPWITDLRQLRGLCLISSDLRGANFEWLEKLSELQWLDLRDTRISPGGLRTLPELRNVRVLLIGGLSIADKEIQHALEQCPNVRALSVERSGVTVASIEALTQSCPNLLWLSLRGAHRIGERSLDALSELRNLRYLRLTDTSLAGWASQRAYYNRIQARLPTTYIEYGE